MARGGIYDQLAGGFARYSVDRTGWCRTSRRCSTTTRCCCGSTCTGGGDRAPAGRAGRARDRRLPARELRTPEGGFASALDADSDGRRGRLLRLERRQLARSARAEDGGWAAQLLGRHGRRDVRARLLDPSAAQRSRRPGALARAYARSCSRPGPSGPGPARDDKVVAAWNGLAITALAEAGGAARRAATYPTPLSRPPSCWSTCTSPAGGRFARTSRDGSPGPAPAVLEDYGASPRRFIALLGVTGDAAWFERARTLLDRVARPVRRSEGGFFDTADDAETLVVRPKDRIRQRLPVRHVRSGRRPASRSRRSRANIAIATAAESGIASAASSRRTCPRFAGWTLAAAEAIVAGPLEIAVVGLAGGRPELHRAALGLTSPGAVVVAGDVGLDIPLFEQRDLVDGTPRRTSARDSSAADP